MCSRQRHQRFEPNYSRLSRCSSSWAADPGGRGLEIDKLASSLTAESTVLLRIFRYHRNRQQTGTEVGPKTDDGLPALLGQDGHALELRMGEDWRVIPANPDAEVCHLGDMFERLACGQYVVMLHRVTIRLGAERLSFPLLIDPGTAAVVEVLPIVE